MSEPTPILAHRCVEHADTPPVNAGGLLITYHPHEGPPQARALPELRGECGACIAEEVRALWLEYLDVLDTCANLLTHHAVMRESMSPKLILPPGV